MNNDILRYGYLDGNVVEYFGTIDVEPEMETVENVCVELNGGKTDLHGIEIFQSAKQIIFSGECLVDARRLKMLKKLERVYFCEGAVEDIRDIFCIPNLKYVQINYENQQSIININDNKTQTDYTFQLDLYRKAFKLSWKQYDEMATVAFNPTKEGVQYLVEASPKFITFARGYLSCVGLDEDWLDAMVLQSLMQGKGKRRYLGALKTWHFNYLTELALKYQSKFLKKFILESSFV